MDPADAPSKTIKVLDHGYVRIIDSWGSDEAIIDAARMSTDGGFVSWDPYEKHPKGDMGLLKYLWEKKHHTPFEMAGVVIEVMAPIMVYREWHRHRTQGYNEQSARYGPLPNVNYLPDRDRLVERSRIAATTTNRQASGTGVILTEEVADIDLKLLEDYYRYGQNLYDRFLENGWPKELARLPVTVGRYSKMRATSNLRNWLAYLTLRMDPNYAKENREPYPQEEIRLYAEAVCVFLSQRFPRTVQLFLGGY